ncbi:MAG TPA: hypothetical protein VKP59_03275 [Candidatus Thermoplasmatota archaeon]|nr:hypothetical protein [Candidatus Thermoplasmatota archaeon]
MKQKLISMLVIMLFLTISISSVAYAGPEEEIIPTEDIHLAAFGSSMLIGLRRVGFVMSNTGEHTYTDITWTFTAKQKENDEIVFTYTDVSEEFTPDLSTIFSVHLPFNVGLLDLTATASCADFDSDISDTLTVFQLGPICIGRTFLLSSSF